MNNLKRIVEEFYKEAQIRRRTPRGFEFLNTRPQRDARIVQRVQQPQAPAAPTAPQQQYVPRVDPNELYISDDFDFEPGGDSLSPPNAPAISPSYQDVSNQGDWEEESVTTQQEYEIVPRHKVTQEPIQIQTSPELEERFRQIDEEERLEKQNKTERAQPGDEYSRYQAAAIERAKRELEKRKEEETAKSAELYSLNRDQLVARAKEQVAFFERSKRELHAIVKKKQSNRPSDSEQKSQIQRGYRWVYFKMPKTAFDKSENQEGIYVLVNDTDSKSIKGLLYTHYKLAASLRSLKEYLFHSKAEEIKKTKEFKPYRWK